MYMASSLKIIQTVLGQKVKYLYVICLLIQTGNYSIILYVKNNAKKAVTLMQHRIAWVFSFP